MTWRFPLVALAPSRRKIGFVVLGGPLWIETARTWHVRQLRSPASREAFIRKRLEWAMQWFEPQSLLVVPGHLWRLGNGAAAECRSIARAFGSGATVFDLSEVCERLDCEKSLRSVAERLVDCFPELERRLAPALQDEPRSDRLRNVRPLLSALAAAHLASVEHIVRFG